MTVERIAAPKPGPSVGGVLLGWTAVGLAAPAALPVAVVGCLLVRARGWRPWLLTAAALVALAAEAAIWRGGLVAWHIAAVPELFRTFVDPDKVGATAAAGRHLAHTLPVGFPLGLIVAGLFMASADRAGAGAPWHPGTIRRAARRDRRDRRRIQRLLERPDDSACDGPALGVARSGDLADWRQGDYAVAPASLRGRAIAVAGSPGTGKTVLLRRLIANDGGRGRRSLFVDAKATEPGLPQDLADAWQAGSGLRPRVRLWPAEALDGWRGEPRHLANRLLAGQQWSETWYYRVASRTVRLACQAPGGPPTSAEDFLWRLSPDGLIELYADTPQRSRVERLTRERGFGGVELRYGDYFDALAGDFDGAWSYDDCDVGILSLPTLEAREDSAAAFAFLLEDLAYYAVRLKARTGDDLTVYLDEFSAVADGAAHAKDLAERLRDVGVSVVFVAQSYEGFGPPDQRDRLLAGCSARIVGAMPNPEPLLAAGGQLWVPEQTWSLDQGGATGAASVRMTQKPLADPDRVRRFEVGQVAIISGGRTLEAHVLAADATPPPAAAGGGPLHAADGWTVHRPSRQPGTDLEPVAQQHALPRVRLQLAAAVREGDRQRAAGLVGQVGATIVDVGRWERWRRRLRRPAFLRWLHRRVRR